MLIGGLQKFSLIDYPGKICAIVFTQGCNLRCPYCHNPELVKPELFDTPLSENKVFSFLENRKGKLDAVEITGGEPTLQPDLLEFVKKIKDMGFLVKLDSNGTNPHVLERIIKNKLVDYLAMDIKAPLEKYSRVVGVRVNIANIRYSINLIMKSGINYEFRTTVVKSLLPREDIIKIGKLIRGAENYFLQRFILSKTLDKNFSDKTTYSDKEFRDLKKILEKYVRKCEIR